MMQKVDPCAEKGAGTLIKERSIKVIDAHRDLGLIVANHSWVMSVTVTGAVYFCDAKTYVTTVTDGL
jgi:hypothetical protein